MSEPIQVLMLSFADGSVELYRNMPALEKTWAMNEETAQLFETAREALEHPDSSYGIAFDHEQLRIAYLTVREV